MEFTEQQISAVARVLSDRAAGDCGVHKEDNWDIYSDHYLEDAKAALSAASAAAPQVVADERERFAFREWQEKTEWVQKNIDSFPLQSLGKHRADVMREEIERLRAALASAPVQPVAVPDDLLNFSELTTYGILQGKPVPTMGAKFYKKSEVLGLVAAIAAPAAQADAKDAERYRLLREVFVSPRDTWPDGMYKARNSEDVDRLIDAAIAAKAAS